MEERQKNIIIKCESLGEEEVRRRYYASEYGADRDRLLVKGWLSSKEISRLDTSDLENKSIARQALQVANRANIIATIAAVAAIIAAVPVVMLWLLH
jgi:hypothetical protein